MVQKIFKKKNIGFSNPANRNLTSKCIRKGTRILYRINFSVNMKHIKTVKHTVGPMQNFEQILSNAPCIKKTLKNTNYIVEKKGGDMMHALKCLSIPMKWFNTYIFYSISLFDAARP